MSHLQFSDKLLLKGPPRASDADDPPPPPAPLSSDSALLSASPKRQQKHKHQTEEDFFIAFLFYFLLSPRYRVVSAVGRSVGPRGRLQRQRKEKMKGVESSAFIIIRSCAVQCSAVASDLHRFCSAVVVVLHHRHEANRLLLRLRLLSFISNSFIVLQ